MNIINGLREWTSSNYAYDRVLYAEALSQKGLGSGNGDFAAIISKRSFRVELGLPWIGLLDAISQIAKGALELILWPVVAIGLVCYVIIKLPSRQDTRKFLISSTLMFFYSPVSVLNRIRLIGMNLFGWAGLIPLDEMARQRQRAFASFPVHQSFLTYLQNIYPEKEVHLSDQIKRICTYAERFYEQWENSKKAEDFNEAKEIVKQAQECIQKSLNGLIPKADNLEYMKSYRIIAMTQYKIMFNHKEVVKTIDQALSFSQKLEDIQQLNELCNLAELLYPVDPNQARRLSQVAEQKSNFYSINTNKESPVKKRIETFIAKWKTAGDLTKDSSEISNTRLCASW